MNFILDPALIEQENIDHENNFMNPPTIRYVTFLGGIAVISFILSVLLTGFETINSNSNIMVRIVFGVLFVVSIVMVILVLSVRYVNYNNIILIGNRDLENINQEENHEHQENQIYDEITDDVKKLILCLSI